MEKKRKRKSTGRKRSLVPLTLKNSEGRGREDKGGY